MISTKFPPPYFQFFKMAMLNLIVDFGTLLIGAEGARLLRDYGTGETPQALKRRGGSPDRPRKAKRLERKSTDKFLIALKKFMVPDTKNHL
jgi:hypothetical protein